MLGFQTLTCLHDIPVVRSSTSKLQDAYAKAKETSVFIRLPCNLAETVADKSLQIALTVANPLVKPLSGPVRVIDDFAVKKIRQIESKYPAINTPTKEVVNSFKDSTASTIQHGKETVSNVASATVNKASNVADSVLSLVQGRDTKTSQGVVRRVFSPIGSLYNQVFQTVRSSLLWFRMLVVFFLLKLKQINDIVLRKIPQKPFVTVFVQRFFIFVGIFLDYFIGRIQLDDRTLAELKKTKQQAQFSQQSYTNRQSIKPEPLMTTRQSIKTDPSIATRQSVFVAQQETTVTRTSQVNGFAATQPDYSNMSDKDELYARLAAANEYIVEDAYTTEPIDLVANGDIAQLHKQLKPTDVELLYTRLPTDVVPMSENQEPLTADQQTLHARIIAAELEQQGYRDEQ
ncbi:unnamed protein product [Adineta ricciae]|uniref:Uncharacterized protein n=1 Tax=Adineta ricciae TaxID=249248 RepID=A0A814ZTH8_ADIRI|nr:unnamed protein product [Adineta ricciae]CAF1245896.1 unnamed protein product [Adineta ricciae]